MNHIGLDVSKDTIDCYFKEQQSHIKISNDLLGYQELRQWIKSHRKRKMVVAMEATGIYYEAVAQYISRYHTVHVINPLKIKDYAKSQFSRTKTDKADAQLISEYAARHSDQLTAYQPPTTSQKIIAGLITLLQQLNQQISQTKNRLHAASDEFVQSIHRQIIDKLKEHYEMTLNQIQAAMHEQQDNSANSLYKNLLTIPSIGKKTAPIIYYFLTTRKFDNANQFTAYAGLSPQITQSGTSVKKRDRLSHYGNRKLKSAFFFPALIAYRMKLFPQLIGNLTKAGKPKMIIIGALMRKLAKICYAISKTGQPFDKSKHSIG